jgi:AcrR family transcriptional regulator
MPISDAPLGLRARKNRDRRRAIVRATAELTIASGYAAATIPRIAERADVAPRTVSTWFTSKDDILFENVDDRIAQATKHLRTGPGDVIDRIKAWLADEMTRETPDPEVTRLRRQAIEHDPELRARERQYLERIQLEVARAVAKDIGASVKDVGPQVFAGAVMAFLYSLTSLSLKPKRALHAQMAAGFEFLRAGLASLTSERA